MKKTTLLSAILIGALINVLSAQPGTPDNTFGTGGKIKTNINFYTQVSLLIQQDGKMIEVGCLLDNFNYFFLARFNADGTVDSSFGTNGRVSTRVSNGGTYLADAAMLQSDGKIVVVGEDLTGGNIALFRYNTNGALDNTFATGGKLITEYIHPSSIAIQSDGKVVIAGTVALDFAINRYNADGALDNTFGTNGKVTTNLGPDKDKIKDIAIQADGKIVAAGSSGNKSTNLTEFALVRYNTNGTLDNSFGTGGILTANIDGNPNIITSMALQADGKIVVTGNTWLSGPPSLNLLIVRFNANGTIDNNFGTNGIINYGDVRNLQQFVKIQVDGKILVAADGTYNLLRYNTNGTLDNSFGTNGKIIIDTNSFDPTSLAIQENSKIVVSGIFNGIGGIGYSILRYNSGLIVGMADISSENNSQMIYPNPTNGKFTVELDNQISEIKIFDILGNELYDQKLHAFKTEFDLSSQPKGIYLLKIYDPSNKVAIKKVIMQ